MIRLAGMTMIFAGLLGITLLRAIVGTIPGTLGPLQWIWAGLVVCGGYQTIKTTSWGVSVLGSIMLLPYGVLPLLIWSDAFASGTADIDITFGLAVTLMFFFMGFFPIGVVISRRSAWPGSERSRSRKSIRPRNDDVDGFVESKDQPGSRERTLGDREDERGSVYITQQLTTNASVLSGMFGVIIGLAGLSAMLNVLMLQFISNIVSGVPVDVDVANRLDSYRAFIEPIRLVVTLICALVFLVWFHQAYKNLFRTDRVKPRFASGWAIGGFFVPLLNLVRPYEVMRELWRGSKRLAKDARVERRLFSHKNSIIGWWWGFFVITSVTVSASIRLMLEAQEIPEITQAIWATFAADLLVIPTAILCLLVVRRITRVQEAILSSRHPPMSG